MHCYGDTGNHPRASSAVLISELSWMSPQSAWLPLIMHWFHWHKYSWPHKEGKQPFLVHWCNGTILDLTNTVVNSLGIHFFCRWQPQWNAPLKPSWLSPFSKPWLYHLAQIKAILKSYRSLVIPALSSREHSVVRGLLTSVIKSCQLQWSLLTLVCLLWTWCEVSFGRRYSRHRSCLTQASKSQMTIILSA